MKKGLLMQRWDVRIPRNTVGKIRGLSDLTGKTQGALLVEAIEDLLNKISGKEGDYEKKNG